jgi:hypothetical protein
MKAGNTSNGVARFTPSNPCPVCGGSERDARGRGERCHGYLSSDRKFIFCAREEHAGKAPHDAGSNCYRHVARGPCPCGVEHGQADPRPPRGGKPRREIERVYQYPGPDGKVVFEVVRYKGKTFSQRRPIGNGQYAWNMNGVRRIPYRLPQLIAADGAEVVWISEGEKDVDNLIAAGLVSTCNPGGALQWRVSFSRWLRGRHVVILPHNDPPEPDYPEGKGQRHAQQVARSLYGVAAGIKVVALPGLPVKGDVSDFLAAGGTVDQLRALADEAPEWEDEEPEAPPEGEAPPAKGTGSDPDGETHAEVLLRLAGAATLFHDGDMTAYAAVAVGGHVETHPIASTGFRRWIRHRFYAEMGRPPSAEAMKGALDVLDCRAVYDGPEEAVFLRVAARGEAIYIDLGDASHHAVEVDATGWRIVPEPPVRFRRSPTMQPLPSPSRDGSLDRLGEFANVEKDDLILLIACLAAALRPTGPYPPLVLTGVAGAAKSSLARLFKSLVDPHSNLVRYEPKEPRDLMIGAKNNWCLAFDNITSLRSWLSDAFCRLSTGGGYATRFLYTNDEEIVLDAIRPVVLTGIEDFVRKDDLADRAVILMLPDIPPGRRKTEKEYYKELDAALPGLFGGLLDALSGALAGLPAVKASVTELPRMGDFALWGEAVSRALKRPHGRFLKRYLSNRDDVNRAILEDSPVAGAIRTLLEAAQDHCWSGTAGQPLDDVLPIINPPESTLNGYVAKVTGKRREDRVPRSPRSMSGAIRRLARPLLTAGIQLTFGRDGTRENNKIITIRLVPPPEGGQTPSEPSEPSDDDTADDTTTVAENGCVSDGRSDLRTVSDGWDDLRTVGTASDGRPSEAAPTVRKPLPTVRKPARPSETIRPSDTQTSSSKGVTTPADGSDGSDGVCRPFSGATDLEEFDEGEL